MMKKGTTTIILLLLMTGAVYASLYAKTDPCSRTTGQVIEVINDEVFKISFCNEVREYKEFSYCYGVAEGDIVIFDQDAGNCKMTGFTVLRNNVQCGVLCQKDIIHINNQSPMVHTQ